MSAFSFINNTASANNTAPAVTAGVSLGGLPPLPPLSPVPYAVSAGTFSAAGFGWLDTSAMPNMEQAQRAAERRRQEVREQQENFIAAMRFPLPRPSPTVSYDHPLTPTFHAPTERLLRCRAVITTVLRYTGLPSAQRLPTDLVSLIASFVHQPGCLGRVRHSLATSAALDVTERQIDDRLCLTASHYDDAGQYSEAQEGCVVAGTTYHVSSTAPPFAGSMSRSVQRGHVYLQWVNSVLVLDERCRLLRRLQLEPPADLPPPPSENGLFFLDEEQKRAWRLKARLQVMYLRVVRMSDGVERLLTLDEESLLHFWSLDGAYHHTLGQGRVTVQRGPLGRVLAVAVSPRDDSLYISQECDGGLRMHHRVDRRDREGREAGQFAELDGRAGGVHTLHLLPSPYEAEGVRLAVRTGIRRGNGIRRHVLLQAVLRGSSLQRPLCASHHRPPLAFPALHSTDTRPPHPPPLPPPDRRAAPTLGGAHYRPDRHDASVHHRLRLRRPARRAVPL